MWSGAVQAACAYCKSILVRHDVNLERTGEVADLPPDASPLQIGAEGVFDGRPFRVIGRIRYAWEQGAWNEWHVLFADGANGWLSDAQAQFAVSMPVQPAAAIPSPDRLARGAAVSIGGLRYQVTHRTRARYEGFEGELPFTTTGRDECLFVDLRTADGRFATVDFSADPPLLFAGRFVDFDALKLRNLRQFEGW
jgi:hypothetical protein